MAKTSVDIPQLKFNKMSTAKYEELKLAGQLNDNEFYITPDGGTIPEVNETTNDFVLSNNGTDLNWVQETEYTKNRIDSKLDDNIRTNCLTKIPQDIKLELVDGALTLKTGSKVYIPNGFEEDGITKKFDEIIIDVDKIRTKDSSLYDINNALFFYTQSIDFIDFFPTVRIYSGDTEPDVESYDLWYDITENLIKTNIEKVWTARNTSLPFCIGNTNITNGIININQIFNGFGYIGSTIFALPGVEGLIPNGRNDDGSLNNTKCMTTSVLTIVAPDKRNAYIVANGTDVAIPTLSEFAYNQSSNKNLFTGLPSEYCIIGTCDSDSTGRVTSFNPKNVFQAVDRNEADYVVESYRNGTEWYRIYKSGWVEQGGEINQNSLGGWNIPVTFLKKFADTNYSFFITSYFTSYTNEGYNYYNSKTEESINAVCPSDTGKVAMWTARGQGASE